MKNIHKIFLFGAILHSSNILFADDIWFISPQQGLSIQGPLTIQVAPPYNGKATVHVKIKHGTGWERTVWRGKLTPKNNYTTIVDTSKFRPGPYELKAKYWIWAEDFDGDIEFWIGNPQGQYYPQY